MKKQLLGVKTILCTLSFCLCGCATFDYQQAEKIDTPNAYIEVLFNPDAKNHQKAKERLMQFFYKDNIKKIAVCYYTFASGYPKQGNECVGSERRNTISQNKVQSLVGDLLKHNGYEVEFKDAFSASGNVAWTGQVRYFETCWQGECQKFTPQDILRELGVLTLRSPYDEEGDYPPVELYLKTINDTPPVDAILLIRVSKVCNASTYDAYTMWWRDSGQLSDLALSFHFFSLKSKRMVFGGYGAYSRERYNIRSLQQSFSEILTEWTFGESEDAFIARAVSSVFEGFPPVMGAKDKPEL